MAGRTENQWLWLDAAGCTELIRFPYDRTLDRAKDQIERAIADNANVSFIAVQDVRGYTECWDYYWPVDPSNANGAWYYDRGATDAIIKLQDPFAEGQVITICTSQFKVHGIEDFIVKLTRVPIDGNKTL